MDGPEQGSPVTAGTVAAPQTKTTRLSCDFCKRMKIKCERQGKRCKHCAVRNLECTITVRERKKGIIKRTEYIAAIEDRIQRMEVIINAAGLAADPGEPESVVDEIGGQADLSDRMSTLIIRKEGRSQFIGASSAFSLLSPRGLQWTKDKARGHDTDRLLKAIAEGYQPWHNFTTHLWRSMPDTEHAPLPTKVEADAYVNAYFRLFNPILPIYEETRFRGWYERQYSLGPPMGAAWYASLNIVLALGSAILRNSLAGRKRSSMPDFDFTRNISWIYFRNASSKLTDLLFMANDIMAIQAILCMAYMLHVIPDPEPAYVLAAAAIRLSHAIGLHRSLEEFGLDAVEKKVRQNVFWVTFVMEIGVCSRCGRPPAMSDQDIAVALPQTTSTGFDHFRSIVTLSLLESRVYSELYSAKAATRSGLERLKSIGRLDAELTRWRDALPLGYRTESEISCSAHEFTPVVMMHFSYYNCLGAVHRASIHHGSWTTAPDSESSMEHHDGEKLNPRVYISSSLCLEAARNIIGLLKHYNRDFPDNGLVFRTDSLCQRPENPRSTQAFSDIDLMGAVTAFLNRSAQFQENQEGVLRIFAELNHIAGLVVRDAQMTRLNELKRQIAETVDTDYRDVSSTTSQGQPAQYPASPDGSDDTIPPVISYPYSNHVPFDQSRFYANDDDFTTFHYGLTDMWTEPLPENLPSEMHKR